MVSFAGMSLEVCVELDILNGEPVVSMAETQQDIGAVMAPVTSRLYPYISMCYDHAAVKYADAPITRYIDSS
jgi:hypothetical protein